MTLCEQCQRSFSHDDAQLHPTLDGIICPVCGAVSLFVSELPSWESLQEMLRDAEWEAHHHPEANCFQGSKS